MRKDPPREALHFWQRLIHSLLTLLVAVSSARAADTVIDDFSSDSGQWVAPDYVDPRSTMMVADGLLNYITRGLPAFGTGSALYAQTTLGSTSPWLIQVDLRINSVTDDRVRLALDLEIEDNPGTGIVFQFGREQGSWQIDAYTVGAWPVTVPGNAEGSISTNLTFQFYFDPIAKEITASHDQDAAGPLSPMRTFLKVPLTGPDARWTATDATRFRARLRGGSEAGAFLGPGQVTFDNWRMVTDPSPRTNEVSLDGTKAFSTIQAAIDQSRPGDLVMVYPGTYLENIDFNGRNIRVASLFSMTHDLAMITNTVIRGPASGYAVTLASGESRAELTGFTLTNGPAAGSTGGIRIGPQSRAAVDHCHLFGHRIAVNIDVADTASMIQACFFASNTGPVIAVQQAPLTLQGCSFVGNKSGAAAVVDCFASHGLIDVRRCLFVGNECSRVLAVPRQSPSSLTPSDEAHVINCTFYSNTVTVAPISALVPCVVLNSILLDSSSRQVLGGVVSADYSVIRGGAAAIQATTIDGLYYGTNNTSDPAALPVFQNGEGIPSADSKTIGAGIAVWSVPGKPAILTTGSGETGPNPPNSAPDVGAVELPYAGPLSLVIAPTHVSGRYGEALSLALVANNGPQEFGYSNLPGGLAGGATSGVISGIPTELGRTSATITVQNSWGISSNGVEFLIERGIPPVHWDPPASVVWGDPLDKSSSYDAVSPLPGEFTFSPNLGAVLSAGTHTLEVTFTPFDLMHYNPVVLRRQTYVFPAPQQIDFNPPSSVVLGDPMLTLTASASSGLPVRFLVLAGPGVLTSNGLQFGAGGMVTLQAQQAGDDRYAAAEPVTRPIEVLLRPTILQKEGGKVLREPGTETVRRGDTLTLSAIPDSGFSFEGWKGDISSRENPLSLVVTSNLRVEPVFTPKWKLALTVTAGGACLVEPPLAQLQNGSAVTITAVADGGYGFYSWAGAFSSQANPLSFTLNANVDVTAIFKRILVVSVTPSPGGQVTVNPASSRYLEGDQLSVSAQPDEGYRFVTWSGSLTGNGSPLTVTLTNNLAIGANFRKLQLVELTHSGQGAVTALNGLYHDLGESVTVRADSAQGWGFAGWTGTTTDTENPTTVVVGTNTVLHALFKPLVTLSVKAGPGGSVQVLPSQSEYLEGSVVDLTAVPARHFWFTSWSGAMKGTNATASFSVITNSVIEAAFNPRHRLVLTSPQDFSQGCRLQLEAEVGVRYLIEVSGGLQAWTPLENFTHQSGQTEYLDTQARGLSRRFYRLSPQD